MNVAVPFRGFYPALPRGSRSGREGAVEIDAVAKVLHGIPRPAGFYQGQLVMAPVMIREFPTELHTLLAQGLETGAIERQGGALWHGVLMFPIGGSAEEFVEACRKVVRPTQSPVRSKSSDIPYLQTSCQVSTIAAPARVQPAKARTPAAYSSTSIATSW
jgi:hypothetical protein